MKRTTFAIVVLFLGGCGGGDDDDAAAPTCSGAHRNGTYIAHFTERANGTCGPIADQVLQFNSASGALPPGCKFDATDTGSADMCSLTREYTCPLDGVPGTISVIGISKEQDSGAKFVGTESTKIYDATGALQCASTYDVSWVRQ